MEKIHSVVHEENEQMMPGRPSGVVFLSGGKVFSGFCTGFHRVLKSSQVETV